MTQYLDAALRYRARGWSIIPIRHQPGTTGKQPAWAKWKPFQTVRPDEATVRLMFDQRNLDGLAAIVGRVSGGLAVRDFDDEGAYLEWCELYPTLATTLPISKTARGFHVFFRNANLNATNASYDDGELKIDQLYIVLPPSRHPSGPDYVWIREPSATILELDPYTHGLGTINTEYTDNIENSAISSLRSLCSSVSSASSVLTKPGSRASDPLPVDVQPKERITNGCVSEIDELVEAAIIATLPTGEAQRNNRIFLFTRYLKAIPDLANADPGALRGYVTEWHRRSLPFIGTKPFEETWSDFVNGWFQVRFPKGKAPMEMIMAEIRSKELPATVAGYESDDTKRLVLLCHELQRISGDKPFFLACRTAAEACKFPDHNTAWKRMKMLVVDKVLEPVATGKSGKFREAASYRFIGSV